MTDRASNRGRGLGLALALILIVVLANCRNGGSASPPGAARTSGQANASAEAQANDWFVDRAEAAGIDFAYFNGMSGRFYFPEMLGGGVGLLDYDNDGDLDIYFAQGQMLGSGAVGDATIAPRSSPLRGRLYRNNTTRGPDGKPLLRFTDTTQQSGIDAREYGMGVATGDVDNDGCVDLYLTNFGPNRLYRNNCDGTFTDVSRASGADDPEWSVSAAFVDYDRD